MTTNRMLIAFLLLIGVTCQAPSAAAQTARGFGVGLVHQDSAETVAFLTRESPLRDYGVEPGDQIIEIDGEFIGRGDLLLKGGVDLSKEQLPIVLRRQSNGKEIELTLTKTQLRRPKVERCGMVDKATGYLRLFGVTPDAIESVEALLDSLALGDKGFTKNRDVAMERGTEARSYLQKQNPYRNIVSRQDRIDYEGEIAAYVAEKYGWQLQSLVLDLSEGSTGFSAEVVRAIKLFCEEHKIALIREI